MSDFTTTPNLGLYKPTYDADDEMWGTHLNANADTLDHAFSPISGVFLPLAGGVMQGAITLAGDPVSALQPVTLQYLNANVATGGPFLPLAGGGTITNAFLRLDGPAGTNRPIVMSSAGSARWQIVNSADAETGNNAGSNFGIFAYADNGAYIGQALGINRASGPTGMSAPLIYSLAPWQQSYAAGSFPNSTVGNWQNIGFQDRSPAMPLPANPLATTAGSPVVTVYWPGSSNPSTGWVETSHTWIRLQGATAVGGITPAGWFPITAVVDNDHFRVTWTANATATVAAGGGPSVTAQPSHATVLNKVQSHLASGAGGFPLQTAELFEIVPDFLPVTGQPGAPAYEHRWHWTVGPNDPTGAFAWSIAGIEWDLTNRGHDWGYQPNIYAASNPSTAFWVGPVVVPAWATGGGQNINWGAVYAVFSGQNDGQVVGVYQAFTAQPNALVGQKFDPTGHGGVGVDLFGSFSRIPYANPFSTTSGSANVTVRDFPGDLMGMANGDQVWIPSTYTVNGVTFGGGTYTMSAFNQPAGTFVITGTGNATATGSGGGSNNVIAFVPMAPYAPMQTWGVYRHGIITDPSSHFLSGALIETQVGNGILWNNGAANATIVATGTAPNLDITLTAPGTGRVITNANDTIALGYAGADTGLHVRSTNGTARKLNFDTGSQTRWIVMSDWIAESGANAGSNFRIQRFDDSGNYIADVINITRSSGAVTVGSPTTIASTLAVSSDFTHGAGGWLAFYGATARPKQTVTGAKGGNAALASLMAALAAYGLVIDSTT